MRVSLDTWIVSDTHFGHANIIRYCNRPENHDELMVENWNATVGEYEDVLHLGDLAFKKSVAIGYVRQLKGRKFLIKGNHDHEKDVWYENEGFRIMPRKVFFKWDEQVVLLTHEPEVEHEGWAINIHGHIHNNGWDPARVPFTPGLDYRNVSIEVMDYKPVRLREILEEGKYEGLS